MILHSVKVHHPHLHSIFNNDDHDSSNVKWLDRGVVPSDLPNFRCDRNYIVGREIKVLSKRQSLSRKEQRSEHTSQSCPELRYSLSASSIRHYHLTDYELSFASVC